MRGPWTTITTTLGAVALVAGISLTSSGAASAATPPALEPGFVTDVSGVLDDAAESRLEQQLSDLAAKDGRPELYVILVPDFEDPANALAWADATALRNNLAPDQYLLAIATEGRTLAISAEYGGDGVKAGPLAESRILDIEDRLGSDYLADDDWAGGIEYVADEFDRVPWPWWVWVLGLVALALAIFGVTRLVLHLRRRVAAAAELRTLEGQKKHAARLLVRADEAVRTSEQELGFVTAEFGEETTAEFTTVLRESRTRLDGGFQLLQKLEDTTEDTPEETRAWTDEIIRMCAQTDRDLDGRTEQLAALRALAEGSAATLTRLRTARAEATGTQQDAAERLAALEAAFPPTALVGVAGNPTEIGRRLAAADAQLEALEKAVQAHRPSAISQAVHEIERLLAEASDLREAIKAQADALAAGTTPSGQADAGGALVRARAAVHAAEASVRARPGEVNALALTRLSLAKRQLATAAGSADADEVERLADSASAVAAQVQALTGAPTAAVTARFSSSGGPRSTEHHSYQDRPLMRDAPSSRSDWQSERAAYGSDSEGRGGKAVAGAIGGAVLGLLVGLGFAAGAGAIVLVVLVGAVIGALSGAYGGQGGDGGSSSSGWGGSSRSRSSYSSGSSRSSRSFSSSSSGGSRSSGRSGGRRF